MVVVRALRDESRVTVVPVLHDTAQAARYADNVVALKDGSMHASGPPEEVITNGCSRTCSRPTPRSSTRSTGRR